MEWKQRAAEKIGLWLKDMGLHLNLEKTRVTHTLTPVDGQVGFDFLGFTIRQFRVGKTHTGTDAHGNPLGFKTLVKPGKEETKRHMRAIKQRLRKLGHRSQAEIIATLNPLIRGWADYYKTVVSSAAFAHCDEILYAQLMSWALGKHPTRGKRWILNRYWRMIGNRQWAYATPDGKSRIWAHELTRIQRFVKVKGTASPYDGNLVYWAKRLKDHPLMASEKARLLSMQNGQCPRCGLYFRDGDLLETDHVIPTALGGRDDIRNKWVYHRHCHDEKTSEDVPRIAQRRASGIIHN